MREIKFRFFDGGKMCEVGDLTFFADNAGYHINGEFPSTGKDLYPLMQFTGLLDKNGKEIYEGDFVRGIKFASGKEKAFTGEVRHQASSAVFQSMFAVFEADSDKWLEGTNILTYELEVIGNIYENPELLK